MRRLIAAGVAALLVLAVVPLASAVTTPGVGRTVAGNILVTPTGGDGSSKSVIRFEVRTLASGVVQFGYYQTDAVPAGLGTKATVTWAVFSTAPSGAPEARFGGKECWSTTGECIDYTVIVTDGTPDTFCGGPPADPCMFKFDILSGGIAIYATPTDNPVSRVGRVAVSSGRSYVDVDLRGQGGLGLNPRAFAELQTYRAGAWVAAVRPNYPVTGKLRIYLNKAVTASTYVAWTVTN
jgi:hypothetical protein